MDNFKETIGSLMLAHARVKAIDRSPLSEKRRKERSQQMAGLRRAVDAIVLVEFGRLSQEAKASAAELETAANKLAASLAKLKTAIQVLDAVASALGAITSLAKLVTGG